MSAKQHFPALDALRVLATAGIVLYHVWSVLPEVSAGTGPAAWLAAGLSRGYLGVVVFNALAGFVAALPYTGPSARALPPYPAYWRQRFGRLWPEYLAVLAAVAVVQLAAGAPAWPLARAVAEHAVFVHSFDPAEFFSLIPALWWMGLLAQFTLAAPFLLRLYQRFGPWRPTAAILCLSWGGWQLVHLAAGAWPDSGLPLIDYMLYYNLPARLPEFALGLAAAFAWRRYEAAGPRPLPAMGTGALLGLGLGGVALGTTVPSGMELGPVAGHALLVGACLVLAGGFCALPAAARLGRYALVGRLSVASYGIYLVHQPLVGLGADLVRGVWPPYAGFFAVTLVCSVLSYALALVLGRLPAALSRPRRA
jgi:peptidoglycan/LPS O-acetylase OafA/YrhL